MKTNHIGIYLLLLIFSTGEVLAIGKHPKYPDDKIDSVKYYQYLDKKAYLEATTSQHKFVVYSQEICKRNYDWQLESGKIIFWVVIGIVITGLIFSGIQFYIGLKVVNRNFSSKKFALQEQQGAEPSPTKIAIGKDGVEVTSPILGVIILTFSLVFFYLYLQVVYPIHENRQDLPKTEEPAPDKP